MDKSGKYHAISRLEIDQCQLLKVYVGGNRFQAQCLLDHRNRLLRFSGVPENLRQVKIRIARIGVELHE